MRWRKLRPIQIVAIGVSVLAAGTVLVMFTRMTGFMGQLSKPEPVVIASVDLRLGNTMLSSEQGETAARADVEAGLLQLQTLAPEQPQTRDDEARARRLKQRYGIAWVHRGGTPTPAAHAYVDGYNRVMRAEIERRHGRAALDRLMPKEEPATAGDAHP
jgi:hypothetical protein